MILVYDGSSVVEGTPIDREALRALAAALHEAEMPPGHNEWPEGCDTPEKQDRADKRYEEEIVMNGGYCDACKDLAAFVLSKFTISERMP